MKSRFAKPQILQNETKNCKTKMDGSLKKRQLTHGILKEHDCQTKRKSPFEKGGYRGTLIKEKTIPLTPLYKGENYIRDWRPTGGCHSEPDVILKDAEAPKWIVLRPNERLRWEIEGDYDEIIAKSLKDHVIETLRNERDGLTISNLMNILGVEYQPL